MAPLQITSAAREDIHERSLAAYPREACGLLIGTRASAPGVDGEGVDGENHSIAVEAALCRNMAEEAGRFELHPEDFLAAEVDAASRGLAVIGVWHSHPDQPAVPSPKDCLAAYAGWSHVISSVGVRAVHALRSWRIVDGTPSEESLTLLERTVHEGLHPRQAAPYQSWMGLDQRAVWDFDSTSW